LSRSLTSQDMVKGLEEERKVRRIATIPEVVRMIVSEYFKAKGKGSLFDSACYPSNFLAWVGV
jgi:hypothetical protein